MGMLPLINHAIALALIPHRLYGTVFNGWQRIER